AWLNLAVYVEGLFVAEERWSMVRRLLLLREGMSATVDSLTELDGARRLRWVHRRNSSSPDSDGATMVMVAYGGDSRRGRRTTVLRVDGWDMRPRWMACG
ncbi:Unknown protein, partial [Striga hermonthica]